LGRAGGDPCYGLLSFLVTPSLRERLKEKFNRGADTQAFLVEAVNGIQTLKASVVEPQAQQRWEEKLAEYVRASFSATKLSNIATQSANLINKLTALGS
jgi:subfamily B ATP-binding cassette protein HlyB/CyaB